MTIFAGMKQQKDTDEYYMRRCLQLAANGLLTTRPNPSVGAVIVSRDGRIIGEGFTSPVGGPHAEVNAFASVKPQDECLLREATIYVSLEPCSHWGHTPPCCDLIISKHVSRCVCGCVDPFAKVQGRGISRMRDAGIEVTVGVLEKECLSINRRFITFNSLQRPYIILKWAQTANGYMGGKGGTPLRVSNSLTQMLSHKLRTENEAILVGRHTLESDHPQLNVREWTGPSPERIVLSSHTDGIPEGFTCLPGIDEVLEHLYQEKKQSLIVEGGSETLNGFISRNLWDEIRVETAPFTISEGVSAPRVPDNAVVSSCHTYAGNTIIEFCRKDIADRIK